MLTAEGTLHDDDVQGIEEVLAIKEGVDLRETGSDVSGERARDKGIKSCYLATECLDHLGYTQSQFVDMFWAWVLLVSFSVSDIINCRLGRVTVCRRRPQTFDVSFDTLLLDSADHPEASSQTVFHLRHSASVRLWTADIVWAIPPAISTDREIAEYRHLFVFSALLASTVHFVAEETHSFFRRIGRLH